MTMPGANYLRGSTCLSGVPRHFPPSSQIKVEDRSEGADEDLQSAFDAVSAAPNHLRLKILQAEAIRLGRCDHVDEADMIDTLLAAADSGGLLKPGGPLDRPSLMHVITEGIQGRESIATEAATARTGVNSSAPYRAEPVADTGFRELVIRCASEIEPEKIEWLWPGRAAVGKTTLIGGEPGLGKSQLTAALSAAVTNGERWPCNEGVSPLGSVMILSAEDDAADTIVPRLMAAGADVSRVHIISSVHCKPVGQDGKKQGPTRRSFNLQADLDLLELAVAKVGDVRLVIIDPISSYMGKIDSHKNADVRATLEPLGEMAARLRVAIVAVTHFSKGGGKSAVDSFIGSIAFVAAARAAFVVTRDPDDAERRLFLTAKNNLAKDSGGLAFRLEQRLLPGKDILASNIVWEFDHVTKTADEVLAERDAGSDAPSRVEAEDFLRDVLSSGARPSKEIEAEARDAGIKWRTVERAKKALGVVAESRPDPGSGSDGKPPRPKWYWRLPDPKAAKNSQDRHLPDVAALGKIGGLGQNEGGVHE
jgi:hypothetical protein